MRGQGKCVWCFVPSTREDVRGGSRVHPTKRPLKDGTLLACRVTFASPGPTRPDFYVQSVQPLVRDYRPPYALESFSKNSESMLRNVHYFISCVLARHIPLVSLSLTISNFATIVIGISASCIYDVGGLLRIGVRSVTRLLVSPRMFPAMLVIQFPQWAWSHA